MNFDFVRMDGKLYIIHPRCLEVFTLHFDPEGKRFAVCRGCGVALGEKDRKKAEFIIRMENL